MTRRSMPLLLGLAALAGAQALPPVSAVIAAGPLGQLQAGGVVSAMGGGQRPPMAGEAAARLDISDAMVIIQKTSGLVQFYVQAGAYNIPILGEPLISTGDTVRGLFGPVPVVYLTLPLGAHFSLSAGVLPTLIGAENTFTFQNADVLRGLLWNQENDVNRGLQLNAGGGRWKAAVSWNDGYYSDRFTWISAALSYTFSTAQSLSVTGGGNWSHTAYRSMATPATNNSRILDVIYSFSRGRWTVEPYGQYTDVPASPAAGIAAGAATSGAALLARYAVSKAFTIAARAEFIHATGATEADAINLLYGAGSSAWSWTATPAWQRHGLFLRGDISLVTASHIAPGDAFGPAGLDRSQLRALVESGLIF